ncbi:MAG TPA: hypothetical protein VE662_06055, partial [Solirubrobacterales bacterium]|nr:hypothetical protein [Solirubrobacterales bacterium]
MTREKAGWYLSDDGPSAEHEPRPAHRHLGRARHQRGPLRRLPAPARSLWHDARYQAFALLRVGFTAIPIAMGIDKYFNSMV